MIQPLPDFDAVIATRNRADALRMSIPLLLGQSVPPRRLIVVDSSDDHESVCRAVDQSSGGFGTRIEIIRSPRGSSLQRNVGLRHVREEIVFLPDDDSMFYPQTAAHMLRIYQLDRAREVGGVCAADGAPLLSLEHARYETTRTDRIKRKLISTKRSLEERIAPDPFLTLGRELIATRTPPTWLTQENAVLVESMSGYRMSYRTESITRGGFHEGFVDYGLYEDTDASFAVLRDQHLVGARNARIYHHRFPGTRANGRFMGIANVLNRACVIARHAPPDSQARKQLLPYCRYTVARYLVGLNSAFGRARISGAFDALAGARELLASPASQADELYARWWARLSNRQPSALAASQ